MVVEERPVGGTTIVAIGYEVDGRWRKMQDYQLPMLRRLLRQIAI